MLTKLLFRITNCDAINLLGFTLFAMASSTLPSSGSEKSPHDFEDLEPKKRKCCCIILSNKVALFIGYVVPPIIGLFGDISDIASDYAVSYRHYIEGKFLYFGLTLLFVFAPSVLFALFMLYQIACHKDLNVLQKISRIIIYLVAAFLLSLWPIIRYLKMLVYGIKIFFGAENSKMYVEKIEQMNRDPNYRLQVTLHAFLESAPQFLLQLYILMSNPPTEQSTTTVVLQIISIILSLNSLTNVVVSFQLDSEYHPRTDIDKCVIPIEYLWWFLSIGARIIAIALYAAVFQYWAILVCLLHAIVMSGFVMLRQRGANFGDRIVAVFVGMMYVFCFVEYKVKFEELGRVVALYVVYYSFTFLQNASMVLCSYFLAPFVYDFHLVLVILHFVAFFVGIMFMLCYLIMLRPVQLKINAELAENETEVKPFRASDLSTDEVNDMTVLEFA